MQTDTELLTLLDSMWVDLGFGVVFIALGFAFLFINLKPILNHPIIRRSKAIPVGLIGYSLGFVAWLLGAFSRGHDLLAWGGAALGVLIAFLVLKKLRFYHRLVSTEQGTSLGRRS